MNIKNVLSLFDGISCGRLALDRAGIKYEKYYASEIDKYAIAVARYNYPDTVFVGDVRYLKGKDFKDIDIIIGGFPCIDLSFCGKRQGMVTKEKIKIVSLEQYLELKKQKFEFEGQSYLFWEFVRLLKEIKPKWFLIENVKMQKKWEKVITKVLNVKSIKINSALVSAQNRERLYWTNIPTKEKPENRNLLLKDIIENQVDQKYIVKQPYLLYSDVKTNDKYNLKVIGEIKSKEWLQRRRIFLIDSKSPTITTDKKYCILHNNVVRKLTPIECERLQTLPDNYTKYGLFDDGKVRKISDTQRYKMIGNGWTVDVVSWIFSFLR